MHLPLELKAGIRHKEKLLEQARQVDEILKENRCKKVLELGCGMGFNLSYLAKKNPHLEFTGIDITAQGINRAKNENSGVDNLSFRVADFNDLEELDGHFDLIFGVETLCHGEHLQDIMSVCSNILSDKGLLVIFDGWNTGKAKSEDEENAYSLLCWGFALDRFHDLAEIDNARGFEIVENTDLTFAVLPNLKTFQEGSLRMIKYRPLYNILRKLRLIPEAYLQQMAAGLLSHYFLQQNLMEYRKMVLQKTKA